MSDYPEKTCQIDRLICQPKLIEATLAGRKRQQRRDGIYAYPGEKFALQGINFVIETVVRQKLGDMTEADAQAEGYPNLEAYREMIIKMHPGMQWNDDHPVWVHTFRQVKDV